MKTNLIAIHWLLFTLLTVSCGQQGIIEISDPDGDGEPSSYLFTNIVVPRDFKIVPYAGSIYVHEKSEYTSLLLMIGGDVYSEHSIKTFAQFKKLAAAIGDVAIEEAYWHATPIDNITAESGIDAMTVTALSQFNETHPEGSSLMDIIQITYQSFDHVFKKKLKPYGHRCEHAITHTIEPKDAITPITHPALLPGRFDSTSFHNGILMNIEFVKPPTTSKQQIEVTMRFANGKELKAKQEVEIVKLD